MSTPAVDSPPGWLAGDADLLDRAPCGFVAFRDDGTIVAANATLAEMLLTERQDVLGGSIDSILSVPARIFFQTHFFPLLKLHGRADEIYFTLLAKDGERVHVLANAARRELPEGARNDCVFIRIRERQKYEQELLQARRTAEEATRAKSRFLSMMSHDLRTPLSAISGYADLLLMGIRGAVNDAQTRDLERIRSASQFLLGLVNDILTVARLEGGQVALAIETVPLASIVAGAESLLLSRFEEAGVRYTRSISDDVRVRADPDRLQQVVLNLLTNAAKFTPAGGNVSVECARAGSRVLLRVSDTGRGIPEDKLAQIFEPFVQVDQSDAANQRGVGLGLAISRELAHAMGGDITVASAVGRGSTFTVSLPEA